MCRECVTPGCAGLKARIYDLRDSHTVPPAQQGRSAELGAAENFAGQLLCDSKLTLLDFSPVAVSGLLNVRGFAVYMSAFVGVSHVQHASSSSFTRSGPAIVVIIDACCRRPLQPSKFTPRLMAARQGFSARLRLCTRLPYATRRGMHSPCFFARSGRSASVARAINDLREHSPSNVRVHP